MRPLKSPPHFSPLKLGFQEIEELTGYNLEDPLLTPSLGKYET